MRKASLYSLIIVFMMISSLNSWGSEPLPQLSSYSAIDTLPVEKGAPAQQPLPAVSETVVEPVVKAVPKSRKKMKPVPVNPKIKVPPTRIIKPRIVIKKINVR